MRNTALWALALVSMTLTCAAGCELGVQPPRDDQLDRRGFEVGDASLPSRDAGTPRITLPDPEPIGVTPERFDCHDGCEERCGADEVCCLSTGLCVDIGCWDCCPDGDHGTRNLGHAQGHDRSDRLD